MPRSVRILQRHSLPLYFLLTLGLTRLLWVPAALLATALLAFSGPMGTAQGAPADLDGGFGASGLVTTAELHGEGGPPFRRRIEHGVDERLQLRPVVRRERTRHETSAGVGARRLRLERAP